MEGFFLLQDTGDDGQTLRVRFIDDVGSLFKFSPMDAISCNKTRDELQSLMDCIVADKDQAVFPESWNEMALVGRVQSRFDGSNDESAKVINTEFHLVQNS